MRIPRRSRAEAEAEAAPAETTESETDLARRVLAHASSPEEKLERLLAERSRELEDQAMRFDRAMEDLERREALLRDMRASVERLLRLGSTDLTEREVEIQELDREVAEREARLAEAEAELNRRRSELGAVELRREAVEQRERALAAREQELDTAAEARVDEDTPSDRTELSRTVSLLFVPGPEYRLVETEGAPLSSGVDVEVDGETYVVTRVGRVPLPGDTRLCAYLERGPSDSSASGGNS
jgi:chromosome segregation ATPase